MSLDFNNFLNLDMENLANDLNVTILESGNADSSFALNHFISLYLKTGNKVCLVNFAQSFTHYSNIVNKLGVNLSKCRETGQFTILEGLRLLGGDLLDSEPPSYCCDLSENSEQRLNGLRNLYLEIKKLHTKLSETSEKSSTLMIVDDLSILVSLGFSAVEVSTFSQYLDNLVHDNCNSKGALVTGIHMDVSSGDVELEQLFLRLCYRSDIVCYISPLKTGYCRDVQGELVAEFRRNAVSRGQKLNKQGVYSMHYKIKDKNVSLFPPGTSAAVL